MRNTELSWKMGGEWIPVINRNFGCLNWGGPVVNKEPFIPMNKNEANVGNISIF